MAFCSRCKVPASKVRACADFGLNSDTAVSTVSFCFLTSPLLSFVFVLLLSIYSATVGNDFGKAFRKEEIDGRKCGWGMKVDFHQNFRVNFVLFFCLFRRSSWLNCVHSGMVLKISSSCTRKVTKLSLSVKTGDVLSDTTDVGPHWAVIGRLGSGANGSKDLAIIKRVSAVMLVAL